MIPVPALLPESCWQRPGATLARIAQCEQEAGVVLPLDYKAFLLRSDGYNDNAATHFLRLWSIATLADNILSYCEHYEEYGLGGVFLIGSNGGPTAFGVDWSSGGAEYISIPYISSSRDELRVLGRSFAEFVAAIAAGEGW